MTLFEELQWRGLVQDISSPDLIDKLNKGGLTFKFQVTVIYKENTVIICPILPIIGIGGGIFTTLSVVDGQIYLKNKL